MPASAADEPRTPALRPRPTRTPTEEHQRRHPPPARQDHRPARRGRDGDRVGHLPARVGSKERPKTGTIEAVGDGKLNTETGERTPLTVKSGDKVIFTSYAGTEIKLGDDELLIMSEDDVLAVID
jgi:chaperonin GroES